MLSVYAMAKLQVSAVWPRVNIQAVEWNFERLGIPSRKIGRPIEGGPNTPAGCEPADCESADVVLNPGEPGTREGTLMAGFERAKVISVDYRTSSDAPYPAALGARGPARTLLPSARSTAGLRITWSPRLTPLLTSTSCPRSRI